jgi:diacylglycerol kinase (ATP)
MTRVAVVAHAGKAIGGGLEELRETLSQAGVSDPIWHEVPKSRLASKRVRRALKEGAELIFVWGGDGMVQRCVDELAGKDVPLAIVPAGTANLFASSLDLPQEVTEAVHVGLSGSDRQLDLGKLNGERFAAMAGAGLDARMIRDAEGGLKDRFGRLAYIWTASKHLRGDPFKARIEVNGELWYKGKASCVLLGNIGSLFGGVEVFENAQPDDGVLEVGVTGAEGLGQWARTLARTAVGTTAKSPFVQATKAKKVDVELNRKVRYELDGGTRPTAKHLKAKIERKAIAVRVPGPPPPRSPRSQHVRDEGGTP